MAYSEFVEWMAFASVEPLPQARADLHTALLMYLMAASNRKKGDKRLKLEKFILDFWAASSSRDPRALERKFRVLTGAAADDEPAEREKEGASYVRRA